MPSSIFFYWPFQGGTSLWVAFCRWHKNFSWYRVNHHQIDWFLLPMYFYLFVCHYFQLKWTRTSTHSYTHSAPCEDCKSYISFVLVYKVSFGFNKKSIKCARQKYQRNAFLNYCSLYIFKICALLCFLNGFGIAFRYSFIRNIQLSHQLYNHWTILWPTKWYTIIKFHELLLMFCALFKR